MKTSIRLDIIRKDGGTQPRQALDFEAVDDYTEAMEAGTKFPPVVIFYDGDNYWLADGFHRAKAADQAGLDEIACDLHQGTQQDAQWYSFSANKTNGLRRTNDDKGRAIRAALLHPLGAGLSDRQIAQHVGVDHTTVLRWREKLGASGALHQIDTRTATRRGENYEIKVEKLRRPAAPSTPPEPAATWCPRLSRLCAEIAEDPVPVTDLVTFIRNSPDKNQISEALEKAHAFLTEVKAALI
mgnify:CR=1 FL=1